jgi:hypothetical protein
MLGARGLQPLYAPAGLVAAALLAAAVLSQRLPLQKDAGRKMASVILGPAALSWLLRRSAL